jgi:hypothetical protein
MQNGNIGKYYSGIIILNLENYQKLITLLNNLVVMKQNASQSSKMSPVLDSVFCIYEHFNVFKELNERKSQKVIKGIASVSDFLQASSNTAVAISIAYVEQVCYNSPTDLHSISRKVGFKPKEMFSISLEMSNLKRRGLIKQSSRRSRDGVNLSSKLINAINKSDAALLNHDTPSDGVQAIMQLRKLIEQLFECHDHDSNRELVEEIVDSAPRGFRLIDFVLDAEMYGSEKLAVLYMCSSVVLGKKSAFDLQELLESIIGDGFFAYMTLQEIKNGNSAIMPFIEYVNTGLNDLREVSLSKQVIEIITSDCSPLAVGPMDADCNVSYCKKITPESIPAQELHYKHDFQLQINKLIRLTSGEALTEYFNKCDVNATRQGINILLHGGPGTGKTELTKQICKMHNRELFIADISNIKDMWVGSSEKRLKEIFITYNAAVKTAIRLNKNIPVLLFDEADAILNKRIEASHSVDIMNNSLQNILLQELENLEGIAICTTNLTRNLDAAFDRRFTLKLEFERPDQIARVKILKSQLGDLEDSIIDELSKFELTGGQILNIKRRLLVDSILGEGDPKTNVIKYAIDESSFRTVNLSPIGFKRA